MSLSNNKDVARKEGRVEAFAVEDDVHIYKGALVALNADGYLEPASDAAGKVLAGIAYEECDNTLDGHSQGGKSCRVMRDGVFRLEASSVAQALVGRRVYVVDDATVDETTSHSLLAGVVVEVVSSTVCWVDVGPGVAVGVDSGGE
jgi:hypothetical protein